MDDSKIYDIIVDSKVNTKNDKGSLHNIDNPFIKTSNEIENKKKIESNSKNIIEYNNNRDSLELEEESDEDNIVKYQGYKLDFKYIEKIDKIQIIKSNKIIYKSLIYIGKKFYMMTQLNLENNFENIIYYYCNL